MKEGAITTEIQKNIRLYLENIYSTELEKLKEINAFLDKYDLPKFNQDGTDL